MLSSLNQFLTQTLNLSWNKLNKEFKSWGGKVKHRLAKNGIKIIDYINQLRVSFLTLELPMEFISIIIDQSIIEGDYALVKAVIVFLFLKWSHSLEIKSSDISVSLFFKTMSDLKLKRSEMVKDYYKLKAEYKGKIDLKNILLSRIQI